jgi:hypothetical protein
VILTIHLGGRTLHIHNCYDPPRKLSQALDKPGEYGTAEPLENDGGLTLIPRGVAHEIPAVAVTPVTVEAFTSLHDLILERDPRTLDYTEKQSL